MGRKLIELHDRRIQSSLMGKNAAHPFNLTRREKERKNKRDSRETLHQPRKNHLEKLPGRLANILNAFYVRSFLGIAIARDYKVNKSPLVLAFQPSRCQNQNFSSLLILKIFLKMILYAFKNLEKDRVHIVADLVLESWQRKSQVSRKKEKEKEKQIRSASSDTLI